VRKDVNPPRSGSPNPKFLLMNKRKWLI